jgi:hypothetical protein
LKGKIIIIIIIILVVVVNIINIIINKFQKTILLLLKKNHKFYLKGKIKNYKNLGQASLIFLLIL